MKGTGPTLQTEKAVSKQQIRMCFPYWLKIEQKERSEEINWDQREEQQDKSPPPRAAEMFCSRGELVRFKRIGS